MNQVKDLKKKDKLTKAQLSKARPVVTLPDMTPEKERLERKKSLYVTKYNRLVRELLNNCSETEWTRDDLFDYIERVQELVEKIEKFAKKHTDEPLDQMAILDNLEYILELITPFSDQTRGFFGKRTVKVDLDKEYHDELKEMFLVYLETRIDSYVEYGHDDAQRESFVQKYRRLRNDFFEDKIHDRWSSEGLLDLKNSLKQIVQKIRRYYDRVGGDWKKSRVKESTDAVLNMLDVLLEEKQFGPSDRSYLVISISPEEEMFLNRLEIADNDSFLDADDPYPRRPKAKAYHLS